MPLHFLAKRATPCPRNWAAVLSASAEIFIELPSASAAFVL
jgi:hypothetical protein